MVMRLLADGSMQEVLSKAFSGFLLRIVGAVAQLGFMLLLARIYGAEGMGAYTLALSVTVIAAAVSRWGVDQAALKNIAVHVEAGAWSEAKHIFGSAFAIVMVIGIGITFLLYLLTPWITATLFSNAEMSGLLRIMVLSIFPFAFFNLAADSFGVIQ